MPSKYIILAGTKEQNLISVTLACAVRMGLSILNVEQNHQRVSYIADSEHKGSKTINLLHNDDKMYNFFGIKECSRRSIFLVYERLLRIAAF